MRRLRQPPRWRPDKLAPEEFEARRDATTAAALSQLTASPEYAGFVGRKAVRRLQRRVAAWLAALLGLSLGAYAAVAVLDPAALPPAFWPASSALYQHDPRDALGSPLVAPSLAKNGSEAPHTARPAAAINEPAADGALKAKEAEVAALRAAHKMLDQERDAVRAELQEAVRELQARLAAAERAMELQQEQRNLLQQRLQQQQGQAAAGAGDNAGNWLHQLGSDARWAMLLGGLLLSGLLLALLQGGLRMRRLGGTHQATLAAVAALTEQLQAAQQTTARLEAELGTAIARAAHSDVASAKLQHTVEALQGERASLAERCQQLGTENRGLAGTVDGLGERVAGLLRSGAALGTEASQLRGRVTQLAADNQALALAEEAARNELAALQAAGGGQAGAALAAPQAPETPLSASESSQPLSELTGRQLQLQLARTPAGTSDGEASCDRVHWPDAELGEELSEQTRSGLAKIKRRMQQAGVGRPARRPLDASTPQTRAEYREGLETLRERAGELEAANASLAAREEQVTASLLATRAMLDAANRRTRALDQTVTELQLALAQREEDCALLAEEAGILRDCARECLHVAEAALGPNELLDDLRRSIAGSGHPADGEGGGGEEGPAADGA